MEQWTIYSVSMTVWPLPVHNPVRHQHLLESHTKFLIAVAAQG
jgi:hypothetical protein